MKRDWDGRPFRHVPRRRWQIRADVDDELRFHLELRAAELERCGLGAAAAREEALRQFGNLALTREVCMSSDERRELGESRRRFIEELRQDVVHGTRQLRRRWPVTVLAAVTLAVGVGASTAIFGATDHMLLRPLPYVDPDRVVTVWETDERQGEHRQEVSPGNFLDWKRRSAAFQYLGLTEPFSFDLETDGRPQAVPAWTVTADYFAALGVKPILGRAFEPREYERNAAATVMISEGLWLRRFGGDRNVVGKSLRMDGRDATIVGVLPASLEYPEANDLWVPKPFRDDELIDRSSQYMRVVGRLKPGVTQVQAQAELNQIARQLAAEYPTTNRDAGINIVPLEEELLGRIKPAMLILLGAVGFLLLIACANVASLLLASGAERSRELAVRAALGAGRSRLVYQLATESALLALIGGALALLVAYGGVTALAAFSPPELPRIEDVAIDGRVLGFSLLVTLLTAVVFGLAPALRFSRPDLLSSLRAGGRTMTAGRERNRLRAALVASEVAAAIVLLIGAGLLMRSFVRLLENDLGFASENRATLQAFYWDLNPTEGQLAQKIADIEAAFRTTPGVLEVGAVSALPFHPHAIAAQTRLRIPDSAVPPSEAPMVYSTIATPSYFRVLNIRVTAGRLFDDRDRVGTPRVALINETLARRFFAGENPIGRRITVGAMSQPEPREIIGVVGDVRPLAHDSDARPEIYVPFAQNVSGSMTFVIHTARDAAAMLPVLRERLWSVDARQSIYWTATLDELVRSTLVERRFNLALLGIFSAVALILAAVGIYGLVNFATQQRTSEIGVRLALGAERRQIVGLIVGDGIRLALPGIGLGVAGALALTRFLQTMLYGVRPTDPATFAQIAVLMLVIAAAAAYIPAWRAVRSSSLRSILTE